LESSDCRCAVVRCRSERDGSSGMLWEWYVKEVLDTYGHGADITCRALRFAAWRPNAPPGFERMFCEELSVRVSAHSQSCKEVRVVRSAKRRSTLSSCPRGRLVEARGASQKASNGGALCVYVRGPQDAPSAYSEARDFPAIPALESRANLRAVCRE